MNVLFMDGVSEEYGQNFVVPFLCKQRNAPHPIQKLRFTFTW
jgi:hypothetical protein